MIAAALSVLVGASTVYLGTHWVSDVVAGWAAGALVLLALPTLDPLLDRAAWGAHRLVRAAGGDPAGGRTRMRA